MEFALIAPVLFVLIVGIIEAGRFILYYHSLNNALREGARHAIVNGSNALDGCPSGPPASGSSACDADASDVRDAVVAAAFGLVGSGTLSFPPIAGCVSAHTTNPCYTAGRGPHAANDSNARGNNVTLLVAYTYAPVVPLLPNITISAESTLVINN